VGGRNHRSDASLQYPLDFPVESSAAIPSARDVFFRSFRE
jgi:hypothetical protein